MHGEQMAAMTCRLRRRSRRIMKEGYTRTAAAGRHRARAASSAARVRWAVRAMYPCLQCTGKGLMTAQHLRKQKTLSSLARGTLKTGGSCLYCFVRIVYISAISVATAMCSTLHVNQMYHRSFQLRTWVFAWPRPRELADPVPLAFGKSLAQARIVLTDPFG